jgi:multimeric flavodoxin WrbA
MKIAIINGSQKPGESNTGIILNGLRGFINDTHETTSYKPATGRVPTETYRRIALSDAIIFAFPLYTDSIPSNTLRFLIELEAYLKIDKPKNIIAYTIINNGFYEGRQTHIAFDIIQNWCERAGVTFGGGIGQGAGEMLGAVKNTPLDKGPFNNLARALKSLGEKIESRETFQTIYLSPYFPRFLWRFMAAYTFWRPLAQKNGLTKRDILKRPE